VQGYVPKVLRGAVAALQHPHLRAVLLQADTPALQRTMEQAGFARYSYHLWLRAAQLFHERFDFASVAKNLMPLLTDRLNNLLVVNPLLR